MSLENLQVELADIIFSQDMSEPSYPHIDLYRKKIFSALIKQLKTIYPFSLYLLGEDLFTKISHHYIDRYPSLSSAINDYGEYFSDYLSRYPSLELFPFLTELAQFEWAMHIASDAPYASSLNINLLEKVSLEKCSEIRFILHPASILKIFRYPILTIIEACQRQDTEQILHLTETTSYILIIRREFELSYTQLTFAEFTFLSCLNDNLSLGEAQAAAININNEFKLEEKLIEWIQDKIIVDMDDRSRQHLLL